MLDKIWRLLYCPAQCLLVYRYDAVSDEEIRDFLQLSPIYERLSDGEKKALLEEMKFRYFRLCEAEPSTLENKSNH